MLTFLRSVETKWTRRFLLLKNNSPPKLKLVTLSILISSALFETDYRVHLVERTHCATESDYDTDDLIEDARNFVITAKRYFCSFVSLELHVYRQ